MINDGHRYRDPDTGTFITRDPLGLAAGPNPYIYCGQNPWTRFDPQGLADNSFWSSTWNAVKDELYDQVSPVAKYNQALGFVKGVGGMVSGAYHMDVDMIKAGGAQAYAAQQVMNMFQLAMVVQQHPKEVAHAIGIQFDQFAKSMNDPAKRNQFKGELYLNIGSLFVGGEFLDALRVGKLAEILNATEGGGGLIGIVKKTGVIDQSLRAAYLDIAQSPKFSAALSRYNFLARAFRLPVAASSEEIMAALGNRTTFARIQNLFAGVWREGDEFYLQGNPLALYGVRAAKHELVHIGASLSGQADTILHEVLVQLATTPEIFPGVPTALGFGLYSEWYWLTH